MGFALKIFVFSVLGYQLLSSHGVFGIQDCRAQLDMVIIVDCSLSVRKDNFDKIKTFMKRLLEHLPIQPDGIRVGVVRYGSKVDIISYLDDHMNKTQKIAAVDGMAFRGGSTFTHKALITTRTQVLSASRGDRADVPDLVILTTDGKSVNETWTAAEATALKAKDDLKIFVIGIGIEVDDTELAAVASRLEMVYKLTQFTQLPEILGNLATFTCSDMKEDSITALQVWPNSGVSFGLPTTQGSLTSTASTPPRHPSTALSTAPSTIPTTALTSTSSSTTPTVLPLTSRSTTNFISNMPSTTLNLLTNETTLPSTELDTSEENAFLLTRGINEDLYNSRLTTQTHTELLDSSLTTEMENNTESTSSQETITDRVIFLYDTVKYDYETPLSTQNVTSDESHTSSTDATTSSTDATTSSTDATTSSTDATTSSTDATTSSTDATTSSTDATTSSTDATTSSADATTSSTDATTSSTDATTSSTDATTSSTSQTTQHASTLLMSPHSDFDDPRDIQDSTKQLHTITSTSTKQLHAITSNSTKQLHTSITSTSTKQLHTSTTSISDTTTAESNLASTDVPQSDNIRANNFTTPHSATNSTVDSSISSSNNNTITPSLTTETISTAKPTQSSNIDNTTSSLPFFPRLTTINKINTLTSTASTAAVNEISKTALSQTSTTTSSQITTTIRQRTRKLISRTSTAISQSSVGKSHTQGSRGFTSTESIPKHDRTSVDSSVTSDTTKGDQFSRSSTPENTAIVEYETYDHNGNISSINDTTTNYLHGETGGDISSRDVYIFIAGGSATAIILLATGTFLSVICRRRNRNRNLERAVTTL